MGDYFKVRTITEVELGRGKFKVNYFGGKIAVIKSDSILYLESVEELNELIDTLLEFREKLEEIIGEEGE